MEDYRARAVAVYDHSLFAKHAKLAAALLKSEIATSAQIIGAMQAAENDHQKAIAAAAERGSQMQQPQQQVPQPQLGMTGEQWDRLFAQGRAGAEGLLHSEPMPTLPDGFNDPQAYAAGAAIAQRFKSMGYTAFASAREAA